MPLPAISAEARPARFRWRRLFRYSLRTLVLMMLLLAVGLGIWVRRAERQRQAVAELEELGAVVGYEQDTSFGSGISADQGSAPAWLVKACGRDMFYRVNFVFNLRRTKIEEALPALRRLDSLEKVIIWNDCFMNPECDDESRESSTELLERVEREFPDVIFVMDSDPIVG